MSSPVLTSPGCLGFSRYENHSSWPSCDLIPRSQRTTPRLIVRWSSLSNSPCASSRRMAPFRYSVLLTLRRSASVADFLVQFTRILIRIYPNRHVASNLRRSRLHRLGLRRLCGQSEINNQILFQIRKWSNLVEVETS